MNSPISAQIQTSPLLNEPASAGSMLLSITGALLMVVLLIVITALLLRRSPWGGSLSRGKSLLTVRHSYALGQRERVVIVEVADRWLLLGVTPGGITLLSELDKQQTAEATIPLTSNFQEMLLHNTRKKSGDHS